MTILITTHLPSSPPIPYSKPVPATHALKYKPTHDGLFKVVLGGGGGGGGGLDGDKDGDRDAGDEEDGFDSCLAAEKDLQPNTVLTVLSNISLAPIKAYSSVQFGVNSTDHFELNSDLLFVNHSCTPNTAFDLSSSSPAKWTLKSLSKPIPKGQALTFFYPSTEWEMDRGFQCGCGESNCLGWISGAKDLSREILEKQEFVNPHIWEMKRLQEQNKECKE